MLDSLTLGHLLWVARVAVALALAWFLALIHAASHTPTPPAAPGALVGTPPVLVCPQGCEMDVKPLPGSRLRAMCWCDTPGGTR